MFRQLLDLSLQRDWKQAVIFYFASLLAGVVVAAIILSVYLHASGMVVIPKEPGFLPSFEAGLSTIWRMNPGFVVLVIFVISTAFSLWIVKAKKAFGNPVALACIILAMGLSLVGAVLSFMPIAYLTTLPKGK